MLPYSSLALLLFLSYFIVLAILKIFDLFDLKRNGVIEFGEFVRSLGVFHPHALVEDKIACKINFSQ